MAGTGLPGRPGSSCRRLHRPGQKRDQAANGGIPAAYQYSDIALTNDEDSIDLADGNGQIVDRVEYDAGLVFPGASTSLAPDRLDASANDDPGSWCRAKSTMPNGDFGTPGAANDPC